MSASASAGTVGRIGPNAIIRVGEVLQRRLGAATAARLYAVDALRSALAAVLGLLGVTAPERM